MIWVAAVALVRLAVYGATTLIAWLFLPPSLYAQIPQWWKCRGGFHIVQVHEYGAWSCKVCDGHGSVDTSLPGL